MLGNQVLRASSDQIASKRPPYPCGGKIHKCGMSHTVSKRIRQTDTSNSVINSDFVFSCCKCLNDKLHLRKNIFAPEIINYFPSEKIQLSSIWHAHRSILTQLRSNWSTNGDSVFQSKGRKKEKTPNDISEWKVSHKIHALVIQAVWFCPLCGTSEARNGKHPNVWEKNWGLWTCKPSVM